MIHIHTYIYTYTDDKQKNIYMRVREGHTFFMDNELVLVLHQFIGESLHANFMFYCVQNGIERNWCYFWPKLKFHQKMFFFTGINITT